MNEEQLVPASGALVSPPDYRDIYLGQLGLPEEVPTSYFVDISMIPIENQRQIGCCVGCAAMKYKQVLDYKDTGKVIPLSFRYPYAKAKCVDGYEGEGTYPRIVSKGLKDVGIPTNETCLNDTTLAHETFVYDRKESNIPFLANGEAYAGKIDGYAFVPKDKESIKQAIFNKSGLILLARLGKEWWSDKNGKRSFDKDKILPIRAPKEVISGHEVYVYGYHEIVDDLEIHFINSWTSDWGAEGTGYFLWSEYKDYIDEMITFTDIPNSILEDAHNQPSVFKHTFTVTMKFGDRNDGVEALQKALTMTGDYKNEVTGYFGPLTQAAVLKFQLRECNLTWYERVVLRGQRCGPKTLMALNKLFGV
jgi:hypothetical protein